MKKILFGAALCVLLVAGIPGNARSDGDSKKGAEFISVSELEVGMTGYGLSVFKGTKIDRFGVEVIGVCYNSSPQIDMILIKVSGCGLEESGIVSGMSGSPIFIGEYPNGRLLGALAYGWSFTLESVAGVTPIESMLSLRKRKWEKRISRAGSEGLSEPSPKDAAVNRDQGLGIRDWIDEGEDAVKPSSLIPNPDSLIPGIGPRRRDRDMAPVATPVAVGGFTGRAYNEIASVLEKRGFACYRGASGGAARKGKVTKLEPGSAFAVPLITGDMDISASGTVTWVDGKDLFALGHPCFEEGSVAFPVFGAYVDHVVKLQTSSLRMTSTLNPLGMIKQDRLAGVYGEIGEHSSMIPLKIRVANPAQDSDRTFNMKVMQAYDWTSYLISMAARNAVGSVENTMGSCAVKARVEIKIEGVSEPLVLNDTLESYWGPMPFDLLWPISQLIDNPFREVVLESVDIDMEIETGDGRAAIVDAYVERNTVEPGAEIDLHVVLRPYRSDKIARTVRVKIPEDAKDGRLSLVVSSGADLFADVVPGDTFEKMLETIRELYTERYKYSILAVSIPSPESRISFEEKEISGMPLSALDTLVRSSRERISLFAAGEVFTRDTEYIIGGGRAVFVIVKKKKSE